MSQKSKSSLPEAFEKRLELIYGPAGKRELIKHFQARPTSFRINTIKANREEVLEQLKREGFKVQTVPWSRLAFILQNRSQRELVNLEIYQSGKIYLQSLASQIPVIFLDPKPNQKVLDLTAAPGSKTSQIAALMERKGQLVANDSNQIRFAKLEHNMKLLGVQSQSQDESQKESDSFLKLTMNKGTVLAEKFPQHFDKILLDAPCSSESRFIINKPESFGYWNEKKVLEYAAIQADLLEAAWGALKVGGKLVYSTCTMSPEENEVQISNFIQTHPNQVKVEEFYPNNLRRLGAVGNWAGKKLDPNVLKTFRIMPDQNIESFFVAVLGKVV